MVKARFTDDGKLDELEMMFDGVAVHQQLQRAMGVSIWLARSLAWVLASLRGCCRLVNCLLACCHAGFQSRLRADPLACRLACLRARLLAGFFCLICFLVTRRTKS